MTKTTQNGAKYHYTKAANNEIEELPPDKSEKTCWQKCALGGCFAGMILVICGIVSAFIMKTIVTNKIIDRMVLFEEGQVFQGWTNPPVHPVMKIYFFNLTNHDAFLSGAEKPRVEKIGPYTYVEKIKKVNAKFSENGQHVTFSDQKFYYFSQSMSTGSEEDKIVIPNLPMFGAFRKLGGNSWLVNGFLSLIKSYPCAIDTTPFLNLSVKQFLWGYPSIIMTINTQSTSVKKTEGFSDFDDWDDSEEDVMEKKGECGGFPLEKQTLFAYFSNFNGTTKNKRTLNTGKNNILEKGLMVSFEDDTKLGNWSDSRCDHIRGRDPGTLSIGLDQHSPLDLYFPNMCRNMMFKYRKVVEHAGIKTWRFVPDEATFDSPFDNPNNTCYCHDDICLPSGIFDIGIGCKPGSPVYMSWPHFLHGDSILKEAVDGVSPALRDEHEFYFDIEPQWGTTLSAHAAFQFNVLVSKQEYSGFGNIQQKVMLPFLMLEEGVTGPNEFLISKMNMLLTAADGAKNLTFLVLVALGFLCMIPEIVFWSRSCCCGQNKLEKP